MKYVIYLICIILITMFLVYMGSIKDKNLPLALTQKLYIKCSNKVLRYLKKYNCATIYDVQDIIDGVQTSLVWSRKSVSVKEPVKFAQYITEQLYNDNKIKIQMQGNKKIFKLNR